MDFINDAEKLHKQLAQAFKSLKPIFNDDGKWQAVRVYDMRGIDFDPELLAAVRTVFAVVLDPREQVLLVEHPKRGWEICGGHLSKDEVLGGYLEKGMQREVVEESGYQVKDESLAFFAHVINKDESHNKELGCPYPMQTLMATYIAEASKQVSTVYMDDIQQVGFFSVEDALSLVRSRNKAILEAL